MRERPSTSPRIFILMSSPLIARNEPRTFRVCAFPSSRSLFPSALLLFFFYHSFLPLFVVPVTRTSVRTNRAASTTETGVIVLRRGRRHRPHDGNPTFSRNPYVAGRRGRCTCLRTHISASGDIYVSTYAPSRGAGEATGG